MRAGARLGEPLRSTDSHEIPAYTSPSGSACAAPSAFATSSASPASETTAKASSILVNVRPSKDLGCGRCAPPAATRWRTIVLPRSTLGCDGTAEPRSSLILLSD